MGYLHYVTEGPVFSEFEANTFWELKTEQATAKQIKPDRWQVSFGIGARKVAVNPAGLYGSAPRSCG